MLSEKKRSEEGIFALILGVAQADERIRAVYMNGSRANPRVSPDEFQDFDIVYVALDSSEFESEHDLPKWFGKPLIVQRPDNIFPTWLMLFDDGNRIDLQIENLSESRFGQDSLTMLLLDKDGTFLSIPISNDRDYWIKKPNEVEFYNICNDFWWCLNNVAKGIRREQLPYAHRMFMETSHQNLAQMLDWFIATQQDFKLSTGMWGKEVEKHLSMELFERYKKTYPAADYVQIWQAIDEACELFHFLANELAEVLGFTYRQHEEEGMKKYLKMMKKEFNDKNG